MADDCILTTYPQSRPGGYGVTYVNGIHHNHHRIVYAEHHGLSMADIAGKLIRHTCHNPPCVNPAHLVIGTAKDNMQDKVQAGRHRHANNKPKLSAEQVEAIRKEIGKQADIARKYGVQQMTISNVINHRHAYKDNK